MTDYLTGITRGGEVWTPAFITALNQETCIGCGRCYKVCPRDVFDLIERSDETADSDDFPDDTSMVMSLRNPMDCIGCQACAKVCPKNCHSHAPLSLEQS
jgi:Nif-specific ferredoxin III